MYKYVTDDAQNDNIIPTAAKVPPIIVTVLKEYLTESILERGPKKQYNFDFIHNFNACEH